jgi:hypothetical protein
LDEYKGDTFELLKTIQKLASLQNIKLCIASRPWTEFVDAFGGDENSLIKLEDLTRPDIHFYVVDRLRSNERFQGVAKDQSAYNDLADAVVWRAQGVFLWVVLVVRSLLHGAMHRDNLDDMHRRLESFPDDLETYFTTIMDDIDPSYRQKTALTFQIVLAADSPLHLLTHYFIDKLLDDPEFALNAEEMPVTDAHIEIINDLMTARLDGRFKGLLEVCEGEKVQSGLRLLEVDFLHRTVKDFLLSP